MCYFIREGYARHGPVPTCTLAFLLGRNWGCLVALSDNVGMKTFKVRAFAFVAFRLCGVVLSFRFGVYLCGVSRHILLFIMSVYFAAVLWCRYLEPKQ